MFDTKNKPTSKKNSTMGISTITQDSSLYPESHKLLRIIVQIAMYRSFPAKINRLEKFKSQEYLPTQYFFGFDTFWTNIASTAINDMRM